MPNAVKAGIVPPGSTPEWVAVGSKATQMRSPGRSRPKPEGYSMSSWSPPGSSERPEGAERYRLLVGDALEMESWGTGEHDLVLLPHLLHLLDRGAMASVLSKARQALKPDGRRVFVSRDPCRRRRRRRLMSRSMDASVACGENVRWASVGEGFFRTEHKVRGAGGTGGDVHGHWPQLQRRP